MLELSTTMPSLMNNPEMWNAVLARDASRDGSFVFAVRSTGIYCRPSCHPRRVRSVDSRIELVRRICHAIDEHDEEPQTLKTLSEQTGVSAHHLQRTFKEVMGITPRHYAESKRLNQFKSQVKNGASVTDAMYAAGYGSSRSLYEQSSARLGMTPATYGRGGKGMRIIYTTAACKLGRLLVAATKRGVCSVALGDSDAQLVSALFAEYPNASIDSKDT